MSELADAVADAAANYRKRRTRDLSSSSLARILRQQFAWGTMPASTVQAIAQAARDDGLEHPEINDLSDIGTAGIWANNCRRDLLRLLQRDKQIQVPKPKYFNVPFKDRKGTIKTMQHPILLPHELLHAIATKYPEHFASLQRVSCRDFWRKLDRTDPKFLNHPIRDEPQKEKRGLPLIIHGDGACYTSRQGSVLSLQFKPLQALGKASWDSVFMMTAFVKQAAVPGTYRALWEPIVRSFKAAYDLGVAGGQIHGVPWFVSADMEFVANDLDFPHWTQRGGCCGFCDVAWEGPVHVRDPEGFTSIASGDNTAISTHPIWDIPGIGRHSAPYEFMHTNDLGVLTNLVGSALAECMREGPRTHKEPFARTNVRF